MEQTQPIKLSESDIVNQGNKMNQLIPLYSQTISSQEVNAVNARDLHEFLGSKRKFSDWIKAKIDRLRLRENTDYITVSQNCEIARGGYQTVVDYFVTLDIAKHIAMMENTDRGFEVRDYFIQCEKQLTVSTKEQFLLNVLRAKDDITRAVALNEYEVGYVKPLENKVTEQGAYIEKAKPKVAFHDAVTQSKSTVDIAVAAKLLNFKGVGRNKLFKLLRDFRLLDKHNRPYQRYVSAGWFKLVETSFVHPTTGDNIVTCKVVVYI